MQVQFRYIMDDYKQFATHKYCSKVPSSVQSIKVLPLIYLYT